MRKYLRSMARHNMKKAGIEKINKIERDSKGFIIGSKFSRLWRDYVSV